MCYNRDWLVNLRVDSQQIAALKLVVYCLTLRDTHLPPHCLPSPTEGLARAQSVSTVALYMVNRPIIAHRDNTHCSPLAVAAIGDCSIWREHDLPAERSAQLAELFDPSSASQLPPCNYRCLHEYYWYWRQYYRTTTHRSTLPAQSALFFY